MANTECARHIITLTLLLHFIVACSATQPQKNTSDDCFACDELKNYISLLEEDKQNIETSPVIRTALLEAKYLLNEIYSKKLFTQNLTPAYRSNIYQVLGLSDDITEELRALNYFKPVGEFGGCPDSYFSSMGLCQPFDPVVSTTDKYANSDKAYRPIQRLALRNRGILVCKLEIDSVDDRIIKFETGGFKAQYSSGNLQLSSYETVYLVKKHGHTKLWAADGKNYTIFMVPEPLSCFSPAVRTVTESRHKGAFELHQSQFKNKSLDARPGDFLIELKSRFEKKYLNLRTEKIVSIVRK